MIVLADRRFMAVLSSAIVAALAGCNSAIPNVENQPSNAMTSKEDWPFADPKNLAVITIDRVMEGRKPILYVSHDADDGGWQFLDGGSVSKSDARVVSLLSLVERDPTLREIADLPIGWRAERDRVDKPWRRFQSE